MIGRKPKPSRPTDELRASLNAMYAADKQMWEGHRGSRSAFENQVRAAWPEINAALARLATTEAERDEWRALIEEARHYVVYAKAHHFAPLGRDGALEWLTQYEAVARREQL
jgi:hypothetical protein